MNSTLHERTYAIAHGVVTPLGFSTQATFNALLAGQSGLQVRNTDGLRTCTAEIDSDLLREAAIDIWGGRINRQVSKIEQMGLLALYNTLSNGPIDWRGPDTLLLVCSAKGDITNLAYDVAHAGPGQQTYIGPMAHLWASALGFHYPPMLLSNACISSLHGIALGRRLIGQELYRNVVVIGADVVSDFTLSGFRALNALSDAPCRPFDAARRGINLGEAAGVLVLSSHVPTTQPAVEVRLAAISNDAHHVSAPSRTGEGLFEAIERVTGGRVPDLISLHGTATIYNDEMEAQALFRANLLESPVFSLKGQLGHTLGAAGVLESVLSIESLRRNQTLASGQFTEIGTTHALHVIRKPRQQPLRTCLKTSSGFGGCNAAVWYEKV